MAICLLFSAACSIQAAQPAAYKRLEYAPAPVDNPLKGLVPYQADVQSRFPHSMEFNYLPYSSIVKGYHEFDWEPLEKMLNDIASRGHQAVFRIFLEYPNRKEIIPEFSMLDAYESAFKITPVLLRYPVGDKVEGKAKNAHRKFGYHDDSFAWATLDTGKQADDWFYMAILKAAGSEALSK
jgi:hypothetical protein